MKFLENSGFSLTSRLKIKNPALLGCSGDLQLQSETFPRSLASEMGEKSLARRAVKHEKAVSRKTRNKFFLE